MWKIYEVLCYEIYEWIFAETIVLSGYPACRIDSPVIIECFILLKKYLDSLELSLGDRRVSGFPKCLGFLNLESSLRLSRRLRILLHWKWLPLLLLQLLLGFALKLERIFFRCKSVSLNFWAVCFWSPQDFLWLGFRLVCTIQCCLCCLHRLCKKWVPPPEELQMLKKIPQ